MSTDPSPRRGTAVLALGMAGAALWLALSRFYGDWVADGYVPVIASLQHYTPFFWDEDRFGQPWGALLLAVKSPLANLVTQTFLDALSALVGMYLVIEYMIPDSESRPDPVVPFALSAFLVITGLQAFERFTLLSPYTPYATSLAFTAGGMCLMRKPGAARAICGFVLLAIGAWSSIGVVVPGLALYALGPWRRSWLQPLALVAAATLSWEAARLFAENHETTYRMLPLAELPTAWTRLATHVHESLRDAWEPMAVLFLAVGAAAATRTRHPFGSIALRLLGAAVVSFAAMASAYWVWGHESLTRYAMYAIVLASLAAGALAAIPLQARLSPLAARVACVALLLGGMALVCGRPGVDVVRETLMTRWGTSADLLMARGVTHLAGPYEEIWPRVFAATWLCHERAIPNRLWGLARRGQEVRALAREVPPPQVRIGVLPATRPTAQELARGIVLIDPYGREAMHAVFGPVRMLPVLATPDLLMYRIEEVR